jgi:metal-sulfur cluster biosynthetic enzyme
MADYIVEDVRQKLMGIHEVTEANVNIVFEPAWDETMMSEQAKADLGIL